MRFLSSCTVQLAGTLFRTKNATSNPLNRDSSILLWEVENVVAYRGLNPQQTARPPALMLPESALNRHVERFEQTLTDSSTAAYKGPVLPSPARFKRDNTPRSHQNLTNISKNDSYT